MPSCSIASLPSFRLPLASWLLGFMALINWAPRAQAFDATDRYDKRTIEGWTVYVNQDLLADKPLADKCLDLLRVKLFELQRIVPSAAVVKLKDFPIWLELNDPKF